MRTFQIHALAAADTSLVASAPSIPAASSVALFVSSRIRFRLLIYHMSNALIQASPNKPRCHPLLPRQILFVQRLFYWLIFSPSSSFASTMARRTARMQIQAAASASPTSFSSSASADATLPAASRLPPPASRRVVRAARAFCYRARVYISQTCAFH